MMKRTDIAIAGLSGQGVIMYCKILVTACLASGFESRTYEVLGTAHRGTLVMSHIRFGEDETAFANLIPPGGADLLVGLEPLEGLRVGAYYLADGGQAIVNTHKIVPTYASLGKDFFSKKPRPRGYPPVENIVRDLETFASRVVAIPATDIARKAGHFTLANMVMLGATMATGLVAVASDQVKETIQRLAPQGTAERNLLAFTLGQEAYKEAVAGTQVTA